ncbi:ABC transporter ATP-binding protein [Oricola nitratireducens]|uniref:ABC transporter ATP-binding protein n=1 Tax=Oricola nitratireducens TaxID=2775868 RepID=UPI0018663789|nr:ABC transporter ATP-binding protein [Oricola nitratireducens]
MPEPGAEATRPSKNAIELRNVGKSFGAGANAFFALKDVSANIGENEFFTLLGPSGCGKTTLLRCIAGFEEPTRGEILLYDQDIASLPPYRRPVNTVFQSYALFPHMTVGENVGFGLQMLNRPRDEIASTVNEMLRLVQMEELRDRRTSEISGGQQQRVALARALAPKPKVLLLDEPLSALDLKLRKEMQVELKRLQTETGITFIFVTHDQEEALTMSDRVAVMNKGDILQIGSPREIYNQPKHRFVADFIGDINFLDAIVTECGVTCQAEIVDVGMVEFLREGEIAVGQHITLAIRPERITLSAQARHPCRIENIVYHGTDTIYHLRLPNDDRMLARSQNSEGHAPAWQTGDDIGWAAAPDALAVIADNPS